MTGQKIEIIFSINLLLYKKQSLKLLRRTLLSYTYNYISVFKSRNFLKYESRNLNSKSRNFLKYERRNLNSKEI